MAIRIIADSVSDIPKPLAEKHHIEVLPLTVNFDDGSFQDGVDLSAEAFFERLKAAKKLPTTSQVPPGVFLETFERAVSEGDQVVCILMSSKLSGTYQSALAAKEMLGKGDIAILDSGMVSFAIGRIALLMSEMAARGADFKQVAEAGQRMIDQSVCRFIVDTLTYLTKGGRLKPAEALVGSLLNIKPVLTMQGGELKSWGKARGRKKAVRLVVDDLVTNGIDLNGKVVSLFHATDAAYLEELHVALKEAYPNMILEFGEVGCVVGTHSGPSCIAVSYIDLPYDALF